MREKSRGVLLVVALVLASAGAALAQEIASEATVPTLTVEIENGHPASPQGVRLSLVAHAAAVPVVLEAVEGRADAAVAKVRLRNTGDLTVRTVVLAVTAIRLDGGVPVRRTVPINVTLAAGAADTVDVPGVGVVDLAPVALPGEGMVMEVAVVAARAADGRVWDGDLDVPWAARAKGDTIVACGGADWLPAMPDATSIDPASGDVVTCDRLGRWRRPFGAEAK